MSPADHLSRRTILAALPTVAIEIPTPAAMHWRTKVMTPVLFKTSSGIGQSSIRYAIPSCRQRGSRISGANRSGD
jgi:hypothetical protein